MKIKSSLKMLNIKNNQISLIRDEVAFYISLYIYNLQYFFIKLIILLVIIIIIITNVPIPIHIDGKTNFKEYFNIVYTYSTR